MIYAYYRKLSEQSTEKVVRQIYQWAEINKVKIDEFMWEDVVRQKTSFDKRNLIQNLLPKMKDGDLLIVSQLSCLGRSAAELDMLFNKVLRKKFIRIICIPIGLDIDFANLKPTDEATLEKIAYAAKLQGFLSHEVTLSALSAKRAKGVKLGAASEKYQENLRNKTEEEREAIHKKKGETKSRRYLDRKDIIILIEIFKKVFGNACKGDPICWNWNVINTKVNNRVKILSSMKDFQDSDSTIFKNWDFSDGILSVGLQKKLSHTINSIHRSFKTLHDGSENNKMLQNDNQDSPKKYKQHNIDVINKSKLRTIEKDTEISQKILTDIFVDHDISKNDHVTSFFYFVIKEIMITLLSKEQWGHIEVESLCKHHGLLMGPVLEQINEYSYSKVEDSVISEDDNNIYVVTEYKQYLI